jgi:hypothetical protein
VVYRGLQILHADVALVGRDFLHRDSGLCCLLEQRFEEWGYRSPLRRSVPRWLRYAFPQGSERPLLKSRPVMKTLELAMEVLFSYTDFHKASFDLFLKFTDGKLSFEEEQMLKPLGVKI